MNISWLPEFINFTFLVDIDLMTMLQVPGGVGVVPLPHRVRACVCVRQQQHRGPEDGATGATPRLELDYLLDYQVILLRMMCVVNAVYVFWLCMMMMMFMYSAHVYVIF